MHTDKHVHTAAQRDTYHLAFSLTHTFTHTLMQIYTPTGPTRQPLPPLSPLLLRSQ